MVGGEAIIMYCWVMLSHLYVILPIAMTRIDFDLVDLNQASDRITDCRVDQEAFNVLWFWETIRIRRPVK